MNIKTLTSSKTFSYTLYAIGALIVLLAVFQAGMIVGYRKASFSLASGERYAHMFGERHGRGMYGMMGDRDFAAAHGVSGQIISIALPSLVVEGQDHIEKVVRIGDDTEIRKLRNAVRPEDLKINDTVIIIGEPNTNAEIDARLIRLIVLPENANATTTITHS